MKNDNLLYRKGVSALIINQKNEFLLVNLESFRSQYFAVPGGGIEKGESLEDAVYREIQEELSIQKDSLVYVGKSEIPVVIEFKEIKLSRDGLKYAGSERYFFGFRFIGDTDTDTIQIATGEVRSYIWTSFVDLKHYLLFDNQLVETEGKIVELFPEFKPNP
jgi:8-oxo-dGTP pyrophosphatase MutT (NUDIX family)